MQCTFKACTVKLCGILKVKIALVKCVCVHYVTEYSVCSFVQIAARLSVTACLERKATSVVDSAVQRAVTGTR